MISKVKFFKKSGNLLSIILFVILFFSTVSILSYLDIKNTERINKEIGSIQKNMEWVYIKNIAMENYEGLNLFVKDIALEIRKDILNKYKCNSTGLKKDLKALGYKYTINERKNPILKIIANNIEGKYFRDINSDSNDIFILTKDDGIISNFSLNTSNKYPRSIDQEIQIHSQSNLAKKAFKRIIDQELIIINGISQKPIGWSYNSPYKKEFYLDDFSWKSLEKLYKKEGLVSLHSYDFLYPFYIDYYQDLAGVRNISEKGLKQNNKQLVVVGSFNLYDIISIKSDYLLTLEKLNKDSKYTEELYKTSLIFKKVIYLIILILSLSIIISFSIIYNKDISHITELYQIKHEEK